MDVLFRVTAGIDVHRDTVVVTVRRLSERGRVSVETRTFETFHDSLEEMRAWLDAEGVEVVGLESTGVYWKPVVRVLRLGASKRVIWLVNPADVKKVPGRKTDVSDSQWLAQLVMHGLVRPSMLPTLDMEELRVLTRHRSRLVNEQTAWKNRIIKQLEIAGIKLATVCSEPLGKSGRAILDAMLERAKSPSELADLARGRLRTKRALIERAVQGTFSNSSKYVLRQMLRRLDAVATDIRAIDDEIAKLLGPYHREIESLMTIPGVDRVASAAILAETGADMSVFDNSAKLAAWSGLAPGSCESAGRSKKVPARKGDKYLRTMLVQAAWSAVRMKNGFFRQKFRQLVARLGPMKAVVAIARRMVVAVYFQLRDGKPYCEPAVQPPSEAKIRLMVRRKTAELEALGFTVTLAPRAG